MAMMKQQGVEIVLYRWHDSSSWMSGMCMSYLLAGMSCKKTDFTWQYLN